MRKHATEYCGACGHLRRFIALPGHPALPGSIFPTAGNRSVTESGYVPPGKRESALSDQTDEEQQNQGTDGGMDDGTNDAAAD